MEPHTPAICSGSGSLRNLELVQAHSLFTFMGRLADGPGGVLRQRLAQRKKASAPRRSFPNPAGSPDGALVRGPPRATKHLCARFAQRLMIVCFPFPKPSLMLEPLRRHYPRRRGNRWWGGSFKVTSQSTGVRARSANRRQELARCCAHGECYLLVIVVVILCPVWQRINEQHANTFCPNICDRHIFRPASKI